MRSFGYIILVLFTVCLLAGCGDMFEPRTMTASDGSSSLKIPSSWGRDSGLNQEAKLCVSNRVRELYICVISENKEDLHRMSLNRYSRLSRGFILNRMKSHRVSKAERFKINGMSAVRYQMQGAVENINVVYLHTTVESAKYYHQIFGWTLKSRRKRNVPILKKVIATFREGADKKKEAKKS